MTKFGGSITEAEAGTAMKQVKMAAKRHRTDLRAVRYMVDVDTDALIVIRDQNL